MSRGIFKDFETLRTKWSWFNFLVNFESNVNSELSKKINTKQNEIFEKLAEIEKTEVLDFINNLNKEEFDELEFTVKIMTQYNYLSNIYDNGKTIISLNELDFNINQDLINYCDTHNVIIKISGNNLKIAKKEE